MIIYNMFLYSGIFNVVLGSIYLITKTDITPEALILGGTMNIGLVLIYVCFCELKDALHAKSEGGKK